MLREIAHTADIGIEIKAEKIETLFKEAGQWLSAKLVYIAEAEEKREVSKKKIIIQERGLDALLVCFLNEILYFYEVEGMLLLDFDIQKIEENYLELEASGIDLCKEKELNIQTEVKAATYHQLEVKKEGGSWKVKVFFDL